jgi:hypothetical protein
MGNVEILPRVFGVTSRIAAEQSHKQTTRLLVVGFVGIAALALADTPLAQHSPVRGFSLSWILINNGVL